MDDPWDWDVDRVVQELCSTNRSWQPPTDTPKFPPTEQLESSLRDQEVNGFALLTYSYPELCSELGFKTIRHKAELQYALDLLRSRSQQYRLYNKKRRLSELETEDDENQAKEGDGKSVLSPEVIRPAPAPSVLKEGNTTYPPESSVPDKRSAKRPRLAPTLISAAVDAAVKRNIPTEADIISKSRSSSEETTENGSGPSFDEASFQGAYLGEDAFTRMDIIVDDWPSVKGHINFFEPPPMPPGRQLQVQRLFRRRLLPRPVSSRRRLTKSDVVPGANDPELDKLLPLYGDSDEEYDSETWEEIEAEQKERADEESRPGLTGDEVQAIIDDAIQKFTSDWKERKLAKLTDKANRLWVDARKTGIKRSLDKNRRDLDACEARLTMFCREIAMQHWRNATELKETTSILQQTVEDREYFSFVLDIISAPDEPVGSRTHVRRARTVKPVRVKAINADEEILTSESEGEPDDFIVDDEPLDSGVVYEGLPADLAEDDGASGVQQQNEAPMDFEHNDTIDLTHLEEDSSVSSPKTPSKSQVPIIDLVTSKESTSIPNGSRSVVQESQPSTLLMSIDDLEPAEQTVAKELAKLDREYLSNVFTLVMSIQPHVTWPDVVRDKLAKQRSTSKMDLFAVYTLLRLFEVYKDKESLLHPVGWYKKLPYESIMEMMADWEEHKPDKINTYMDFLQRLSDRFDWDRPTSEVEDTTSTSKKTPSNTSPSNSVPEKRRRRKRLIRNREAENLRESDRARVAEQAHRRDVLRKKLELLKTSGEVNLSDKDIIINESKADDQGLIYVHPEIAPRIKEHQVAGVRFMWDQIVSSVTMQGCLLAHTMGLGKTMQIITLLLAISEAAGSSDPRISSQIPAHLKESKTLILCPPSVIDNWMDELLFWAPEGHRLGDFFKIDQSSSRHKREEDILTWDDRGGVIIFGYTLFRDFMNEDFMEILTEGPNLVVADEAHMLKNPKSQVHNATANFKTHSRIALTGSPLANKVEEYHAMINWVAPNYLSDLRDFRAHYANPIKDGLSADSTTYQRRHALKMLKVLKEEVTPKVQRVTTAVLKHDLPTKKEFVLTVPMTEVQRAAYETFIRYHLDHSGTSALASLDTLSILCAHPAIFNKKLESQKSGSTNDRKKMETLPSQLVSEEITLLRKVKDLKDHSLSWKVLIFLLILDECKRIGDTVLLFSQSIPTLDYLEDLLRRKKFQIRRLDGSTPTEHRQGLVKEFNKGKVDIFLISTRAGGVGLNMTGANRVIIFDAKFNPQHEQQAVGRAYRIGQKKAVYVYRFVCGGTSEAKILNMAIWKMQLASRVVDKKNPIPKAEKFGAVLEMPTDPEQKDIGVYKGEDDVLDLVIDKYGSGIRAITMMDTFEEEELEDAVLTPEDRAEADRLIAQSEARRSGKPITPTQLAPMALYRATRGPPGDVMDPYLPQTIVQNGHSSSSTVTNGANLGDPKITEPFSIDNDPHQHDPMQPIQGTTTHIRSNASSRNRTSILQDTANWETRPAFHRELTRLFMIGASSHDQDRRRRIVRAISAAVWGPQQVKGAIITAAGSPRFVEAMCLGLLSPTDLAEMTQPDIESHRADLDKLTAEEWEIRKSTVGSRSETDPEHLQYALQRMLSTPKKGDSRSGQHKPQRLDDQSALEAVIERRKAKQSSRNKDPRLPNWAIDAVTKQQRIIPPSTPASSTPSTSTSHLPSKTPFK
ncbi:P-loop containing nucleoside triphosphate hydrolase protein [Hypoxylon sp. FL0890]|nr:P-loop containing nucleoside triphosphate hydrolase protein [Hypoxylon sp. FL0890]